MGFCPGPRYFICHPYPDLSFTKPEGLHLHKKILTSANKTGFAVEEIEKTM